jgi:hypothetical protein
MCQDVGGPFACVKMLGGHLHVSRCWGAIPLTMHKPCADNNVQGVCAPDRLRAV